MRIDRTEIGKVPLQSQCLAAFGFDRSRGLLSGGEIDIRRSNSGAFARKLDGNRAAQSAAGAKHQGRLVLQAEIHSIRLLNDRPSFGAMDYK